MIAIGAGGCVCLLLLLALCICIGCCLATPKDAYVANNQMYHSTNNISMQQRRPGNQIMH